MKHTKTDAVLSLYPGVGAFERSEDDVSLSVQQTQRTQQMHR